MVFLFVTFNRTIVELKFIHLSYLEVSTIF